MFTNETIYEKLCELTILESIDPFPELDFAIKEAREHNPEQLSLDEVVDQVLWVFACEWDCNLEYWVHVYHRGRSAGNSECDPT